jgi:phosphatidylglycerol:prolipoprotein diacylglycerol transferase
MGWRILLPLYGPFAIHSYGLMIAISFYLFFYFIQKDTFFKALGLKKHFSIIIFIGLIAGIVGARLLYVWQEWHTLSSWYEMLAMWEGGGSELGSVLLILAFVSLYLFWYSISVIKFFDLVALYAPLLQGVSRLGCFFAGCCSGVMTTSFCNVVYTDPESLALLYVPIHPIQLYTFLLYMILFVFMHKIARFYLMRDGQLISCYLFFASLIRFSTDFLRNDRDMMCGDFSSNQVIALGIMLCALSCFLCSLYFSCFYKERVA